MLQGGVSPPVLTRCCNPYGRQPHPRSGFFQQGAGLIVAAVIDHDRFPSKALGGLGAQSLQCPPQAVGAIPRRDNHTDVDDFDLMNPLASVLTTDAGGCGIGSPGRIHRMLTDFLSINSPRNAYVPLPRDESGSPSSCPGNGPLQSKARTATRRNKPQLARDAGRLRRHFQTYAIAIRCRPCM